MAQRFERKDRKSSCILTSPKRFASVRLDDADPAAWYHGGVHYRLKNGPMIGTFESEFEPDSTITRAESAAMIQRRCELER